MTLIAIGVALNVLVIALNQGMPTKDDVRERNGREVHVPIEQTVKHRPQEDDDLLVVPRRRDHRARVPEPAVLDRRHRDRRSGSSTCASRAAACRGDAARRRRDRQSAQHELIVEQPAPVEHHLERGEHARVVEVRGRRAQRFEREAGALGVTVGQLVERARDLEDLARHHRRARRHVLPVRHPLGGDDVAGRREQLRAAQDRGAGLRDRDRLGRAAVVGLVEAHLAEVVQQRGGLELRRARDARSRASLPIATARSATRSACPSRTMPPSSGAAPSARIVWSYVRRIDVEVLVRVPGGEQRDGEHRRAPEAHAAVPVDARGR